MPLTRNQSSAAAQAKLSAADSSETSTSKDSVDQGGTSGESEPPRRDSPDNCSICLGPFNNKSFTSSCAHSFCFVCLKQWSKIKPECPLCKQPFTSIFHDIRSNQHYDIYELPHQPNNQIDFNIFNYVGGPIPSFSGPTHHLFSLAQPAFDADLTLSNFSRFQFRQRRYDRYLNPLGIDGEHPYSYSGQAINPSSHFSAATWPRGAEEFRGEVYRRNIGPPAVILGYENSTYRLTPTMVAASAHRVHRIMPWLTRELRVLLRSHQDVRRALGIIQPLLSQVTIDSTYFYDKIVPLIGHRSRQFVQEFVAFANSALITQAYDRKAMYRRREVVPAATRSSSSPSSENDVVEVTDISPDVYPATSASGPSQTQPLNLSRSGWDSPTPGPSWSSSNAQNVSSQASVIERVSVSSESDDPVYRPDLRDSDSDESRPGSDIIFVKYDKPWNERSPIQLASDSEGGVNTGAEPVRKKKKSKHKKKKKEAGAGDDMEASGSKKDKTKKSSSKSKHRDKSKGSSKAVSDEERDSAARSKRHHSQSSTEQHKVKKHKKSKSKKEKLTDREIVDRYFAEAMAEPDKKANPTKSDDNEEDISTKRKDKERHGTSSSRDKSKKKRKSRKHSKDSHNQSYKHTYKKHPSGHKKSSNRLTEDLSDQRSRPHHRRSPIRANQVGTPNRHESMAIENQSQHEASGSSMSHPGFQPSYLSMTDTVQPIPVNLWVSAAWPTLSVSRTYPPPPPIPMGQNIPQSSNTSSSFASNPSGAGPNRFASDMLSISSDSSSDSSESESDDAQALHIPSLQNVHSRTKQWLETNFPDLGRPQASSASVPTSSFASSSTNEPLLADNGLGSQNHPEQSLNLVEAESLSKEKEEDIEVVSIPSGEEDVLVCSSDDSCSSDDLFVIDDDQSTNNATKINRKENVTDQPGSSKKDEVLSVSNISTLPFYGDIGKPLESKSQPFGPGNIILPPVNKSFQPFKLQKKPAMSVSGKDPFFPPMTHSSDEDGEVDTILHGASNTSFLDNPMTSQAAHSTVLSLNSKSELANINRPEDVIVSTTSSIAPLTNTLGVKETVYTSQENIESLNNTNIFQAQNIHMPMSTSLTSASFSSETTPVFSVLPPLTSSNPTTSVLSSGLSSGIKYLPYSNLPPTTSMSSLLPCFMPQSSIPPPPPPLSLPLSFPYPQIPPLLARSNPMLPSFYSSQGLSDSSKQPEMPGGVNSTSNLYNFAANKINDDKPNEIIGTDKEITQESPIVDNRSSRIGMKKDHCIGLNAFDTEGERDQAILDNTGSAKSVSRESEIFSSGQLSNNPQCGTSAAKRTSDFSVNGYYNLEHGQLRHDFPANNNSFEVVPVHEEEKQNGESKDCPFPGNTICQGSEAVVGSATNYYQGSHLVNEFNPLSSYNSVGEEVDLSDNAISNTTNGVPSADSFSEQDTNDKPFDILESLAIDVPLQESLMATSEIMNLSHSTPTGLSIVTTVADRFEQSMMLNSVPSEPTLQQPSVVSTVQSSRSQFASSASMSSEILPVSTNPAESHVYGSNIDYESSTAHEFKDALASSGASSSDGED